MKLDGKVALVTGSSRGIGKAIALEFGKEGASVIITYNENKTMAEEVSKQIENSMILKLDISNRDSIKTAVKEIIQKYGRIDILVNNAGINKEVPNLLNHAFRRRFNTILKLKSELNPTIIERLMGHDQGLDNSYFQPTEDQLFKEYVKGMTDLSIDDNERLLAEREIMQEEIKTLESEKAKNNELTEKMLEYEANQKEILQVMKLIQSGQATLKNSPNGELHVTLNPQ